MLEPSSGNKEQPFLFFNCCECDTCSADPPDSSFCCPAAEDPPQPVLPLHPLRSVLRLPHRCLHHHGVPAHM